MIGSAVLIRPVRPADAGLLADGFARLSDRSRRMRFLGPKDALSADELRYFTDVDHRDHEALGALDHAPGCPNGPARRASRFTAAVAADNAAMAGREYRDERRVMESAYPKPEGRLACWDS